MLKSPIIYVIIHVFGSREESIFSSVMEKFSVPMSTRCLYTLNQQQPTLCVQISKVDLYAISSKSLLRCHHCVIFNIKCQSTFVRLIIICKHVKASILQKVSISLSVYGSQIPITEGRKLSVISSQLPVFLKVGSTAPQLMLERIRGRQQPQVKLWGVEQKIGGGEQ